MHFINFGNSESGITVNPYREHALSFNDVYRRGPSILLYQNFAREKTLNAFPKRQIVFASVRFIGL